MRNTVKLQYVGFILTAGLSLILSVQLFTSVADNRFSFALLMGTAVVLELGKILTLNDQRRLLSGLLIAVSVFGSAGGLSRAIDSTRQQQASVMANRQLLLAEIEQNNQAINRYIELDQIRRDAQPLQARNAELRDQLNRLPQAETAEMISLLSLLSALLALPLSWVKAAVVLLLAGLLDALLWSFIRQGTLVQQSSDDPDRLPLPDTRTAHSTEPVKVNRSLAPLNVQAMADSYPSFRRSMIQRRDSGQNLLAQRACVRESGMRERRVREYYQRLVTEGVIEKVKGQYRWRMVQPTLFKKAQ